MSYDNRYRRRARRSDSGGDFVSVFVGLLRLAKSVGPVGALITGVVSFIGFFWVVPVLLTGILSAIGGNRKVLTPQDAIIAKVPSQIIEMLFIGPSRWVGVILLLACIGIATWKAISAVRAHNDEA